MIFPMLRALTSKMRVWAAAGMAGFYAACIFAPVAAFAFGHGEAHCLTQDNHGLSAVHVHDDGTVHRHSNEPADADVADGAANPNAVGKCCGLICLAAMVPPVQDPMAPGAPPTLVFPLAEDALVGGIPARLDRPPAPAI
jgi:hypothetical protein